jgi:hypothetical protein
MKENLIIVGGLVIICCITFFTIYNAICESKITRQENIRHEQLLLQCGKLGGSQLLNNQCVKIEVVPLPKD